EVTDQNRPIWKSPWMFAVLAGSVALGLGLAVAMRPSEPVADSRPVAIVPTPPPLTPPVVAPPPVMPPVVTAPPPVTPVVEQVPVDPPVEERHTEHHHVKHVEAPPPAPKPGKVIVRVNPYAEVFYRGKSLGITPIEPV